MPGGREVRIAAVADLHAGDSKRDDLKRFLGALRGEADFLALCGDVTADGRPRQLDPLVEELAGVDLPTLAVLGNHDHDGEAADELTDRLEQIGVHVLDGGHVTIEGVGFVGTKGFAGGFGEHSLAPFGERTIKDFAQVAIDEELKLENGLRRLNTELKVVLLHYAPIAATVAGEPEAIHPFLGSSRLAQPLDTHGASVVFHGHAHHGTPRGATSGGVPVHNVALPLLREHGREFLLWTAEAPDRRAS